MADRIRRLRRSHGWKQEELAAKVGVARLAVTKWETAGHAPSAENLGQLATVLGVTSDYLLYGEGGIYREAVKEIAEIVERVRPTSPDAAPAPGPSPDHQNRQAKARLDQATDQEGLSPLAEEGGLEDAEDDPNEGRESG